VDYSLVTNDVHVATKEDIDIAVSAAQVAFTEWSSTLPQIRAKILNKFADLLEEHAEQLSLLESACSGQPKLAMKSVIIPSAATRIRCMKIYP
jgi:acyl-CoA reductase-like NAD-dependent aldehyde dehydrogenase